MTIEPHDHQISLKGGSFNLTDLGQLLPGMAEIMPLVGARIWKCYYAGRARNRALASFQLREAATLMEKGALLRPKYADDIATFLAERVAPVAKTIQDGDWDRFEASFANMVDAANEYHDQYGRAYLRWKVPDQPPPDLDMTPRD